MDCSRIKQITFIMSKYSHQQVDPADKNSTLTKIIDLVDKGTNVLDVGCSSGYIGSYLVKNKGCTVWGVEIDEKDANEARKTYKKVHVADLDNSKWTTAFKGLKFDRIIFADVLEHLKFPEKALNNAKSLLTKNGRILISIPNIAHASIRLELLQGSFEYEGIGILDNTHLKYWTKDSFLRVVEACDMHATHIDTVQTKLEKSVLEKTLDEDLKPLLKRLLTPEASAYQYIFALKDEKKKHAALPPIKPFSIAIDKYVEEHVEKYKKEQEKRAKLHQEFVKNKEGELKSKEHEIKVAKNEVKKLEADIKAHQKEQEKRAKLHQEFAKHKEGELKAKEHEIKVAKNEVKRLEADIKAHQKEQEKRAKLHQEFAKHKEGELKAKEHEIKVAKNEVKKLEADIKAHQKEQEKRAKLHQEFAKHKEGELKAKEDEIKAKKDEIKRLKADIKAYQKEQEKRAKLHKEFAKAKETEIKDLKADLHKIHRTLIYRACHKLKIM